MSDRATHCPGCGIPITDWEQVTGTYVVIWPCESRSFQVSEVARVFGIPPHMLMDTVLASRAWAVWDRKRRARRKR